MLILVDGRFGLVSDRFWPYDRTAKTAVEEKNKKTQGVQGAAAPRLNHPQGDRLGGLCPSPSPAKTQEV